MRGAFMRAIITSTFIFGFLLTALGFILAPVTNMSNQAMALSSTCYATFTEVNGRFTITACSYDGGRSGFIKIKNNTVYTQRVCWDLYAEDGSTIGGCNAGLEAGKETSSTCTICNLGRTGGIGRVYFRDIEMLD